MTVATEVIQRVRISEVWAALGGGWLRKNRGKAFWRDGGGYNVSLNDRKGCWHDFVSGDAGGVLDLVQQVRGGSRAEALKYVADIAGVTLDAKPMSHPQKRRHAKRMVLAGNLAQQCAWWARAYINALEYTKAGAYDRDDFDTLCWSSRELYKIQKAIPSALMNRFLKAMEGDPEETNGLVEAGRDDEHHAYAVAVAIVIMLKHAQEREEAARV